MVSGLAMRYRMPRQDLHGLGSFQVVCTRCLSILARLRARRERNLVNTAMGLLIVHKGGYMEQGGERGNLRIPQGCGLACI